MRLNNLKILIIASLFLAVLSSVPSLRENIKNFIFSAQREVLAKVQTTLTPQGENATIVKVKTRDTLSVEVHFEDAAKQREIRRVILSELRDGYFNFRGKLTNLAVTDIDGDGVSEIIAPAFDENLMMRLNVFKFNPEDRSFSRLGPENISL